METFHKISAEILAVKNCSPLKVNGFVYIYVYIYVVASCVSEFAVGSFSGREFYVNRCSNGAVRRFDPAQVSKRPDTWILIDQLPMFATLCNKAYFLKMKENVFSPFLNEYNHF